LENDMIDAETKASARRAQAVNALTKFDFAAGEVRQEVRVVTIDGEPWFVAADACRALGIGVRPDGKVQVNQPCKLLSADERGTSRISTPSGAQGVVIISESGLYKLVMRCDKPAARAFQDWVTRDVLPSIRKTGRFDVAQAPAPRLPMTVKHFQPSWADCTRDLRDTEREEEALGGEDEVAAAEAMRVHLERKAAAEAHRERARQARTLANRLEARETQIMSLVLLENEDYSEAQRLLRPALAGVTTH
jgi:prophage antirepressor-like protein